MALFENFPYTNFHEFCASRSPDPFAINRQARKMMMQNIAVPPAHPACKTSLKSNPRDKRNEYCKLKSDISAAVKVMLTAAKCKGLLSFDHFRTPKSEDARE